MGFRIWLSQRSSKSWHRDFFKQVVTPVTPHWERQKMVGPSCTLRCVGSTVVALEEDTQPTVAGAACQEVDEALVAEAAQFQGTMSYFPSSFFFLSLRGAFFYSVFFFFYPVWVWAVKSTETDGSTVLLQANLGVSDLGTRVGEVEECSALVKGCVAERLMRDPASPEGEVSGMILLCGRGLKWREISGGKKELKRLVPNYPSKSNLNHAPLLLDGVGIRNGKTPFRWLKVEGFKDLVRNWWGGECSGSFSHILAVKLKALKQDLKYGIGRSSIMFPKNTRGFDAIRVVGCKGKEMPPTVEEYELMSKGVLFSGEDNIKESVENAFHLVLSEVGEWRPSIDGLVFDSLASDDS
ncbi:hypothetical protein AAG906_026580 [Vitis piasezkii]